MFNFRWATAKRSEGNRFSIRPRNTAAVRSSLNVLITAVTWGVTSSGTWRSTRPNRLHTTGSILAAKAWAVGEGWGSKKQIQHRGTAERVNDFDTSGVDI